MTKDVLKLFPLEFGREFTTGEIATIREHLLGEYSHAVVADSWNVEVFGGVRFVGCGVSLARISCPLCREKVELDDWSAMLEEASSVGNYDPSRRFKLACSHEFPLHSLNYKDKVAFASSLISVEVTSHVWMGWVKEFPWIGYIEASYDSGVVGTAARNA